MRLQAGLLLWDLHYGRVALRANNLLAETWEFAVGEALGLDEFRQVGGAAPRSVVAGSVFTANESPADQLIPFLCFYCQKPARQAGETPIVLSNLVFERIKGEIPAFVAELEEKGGGLCGSCPRTTTRRVRLGGGGNRRSRCRAGRRPRRSGGRWTWSWSGCRRGAC